MKKAWLAFDPVTVFTSQLTGLKLLGVEKPTRVAVGAATGAATDGGLREATSGSGVTALFQQIADLVRESHTRAR